MSRTRAGLVAGAVLVVVAVGWFGWKRSGSEAPKFRTAAVERGVIEELVSATGTVQPVEQVDVGSQVSGTVYRLHADYNSRVKAGQVLCEIEPSSFRARAAQSEAAVARSEAAVREAKRQLDRAKELLPQNYVSQADVDASESTLQQREADLKQARAQLDAARVDLQNTTIRSPIDGVVIARSVNLGQTVAASLQAPKLFVIANDLTQMQVETRIDEADIGQVHAGLPVRFTVDAFPEVEFRGSVTQVRLEPIVEQNVVTYTTVIRTDNGALRLRPGMTANVSVEVASRDDALKVPNSALRFRLPAAPGAGRGAANAESANSRAGGRGPGGAMAGGAANGGGAGAGMRGGAGGARGPGAGGGATPSSGATRRGGGKPGADAEAMATGGPAPLKPGAVFVLRNGKPTRVAIETGITDGAFTEGVGDGLKPGDLVIVGMDNGNANQMELPPGMGGFGGGRRGGRR